MTASDIQPLLEQAAHAYQRKEFSLAESLAAQACRKAPASVDAWDFHGMACQELGNTEEAANSYKKALKLTKQAYKKNPKDGKMALRQLFLLMRLDRKSDIDALLALLQKRHPDSPGLKKLLASYRLKQRT